MALQIKQICPIKILPVHIFIKAHRQWFSIIYGSTMDSNTWPQSDTDVVYYSTLVCQVCPTSQDLNTQHSCDCEHMIVSIEKALGLAHLINAPSTSTFTSLHTSLSYPYYPIFMVALAQFFASLHSTQLLYSKALYLGCTLFASVWLDGIFHLLPPLIVKMFFHKQIICLFCTHLTKLKSLINNQST